MPGRAQDVGPQDRAAAERLLDIGVGAVAALAARRPTWCPGSPAPAPRPARRRPLPGSRARPPDQPLVAQASLDDAGEARGSGRGRRACGARRRAARRGRWAAKGGNLGRAVYLDPVTLEPLARWVQRGGVGRASPRHDRRPGGRRRCGCCAQRLRRGDAAAFDEVYRRYTPGLFAFLARLSRAARPIAEELLQETWVRLRDPRARRSLATPTCVPGCTRSRGTSTAATAGARCSIWISCASGSGRRAINRPRRRRTRWPSRPKRERRLEAAVAALPVAQREILLLVAVEGFSPSQAAEILRLRPEAARQRLRRARAAIGAALEDAVALRASEGDRS